MDHSHNQTPVLGLMATGWLVALLAGDVAAGLAFFIGGAAVLPAAIIGAVTFGVFGVLLGKGGVEAVPLSDTHADHDHADHHHGDHH